MVALEGRGNFPALELKLKDLLTAVKDRLVQEGIKVSLLFRWNLINLTKLTIMMTIECVFLTDS